MSSNLKLTLSTSYDHYPYSDWQISVFVPFSRIFEINICQVMYSLGFICWPSLPEKFPQQVFSCWRKYQAQNMNFNSKPFITWHVGEDAVVVIIKEDLSGVQWRRKLGGLRRIQVHSLSKLGARTPINYCQFMQSRKSSWLNIIYATLKLMGFIAGSWREIYFSSSWLSLRLLSQFHTLACLISGCDL